MVYLKNNSEIALMREAGKIAGNALAYGGSLVKEGVSTLTIDAKIRSFITGHGAKPSFLNYNGFPNSACISINEQVIHGIPSDRILKEGDIVKIDVGAFYKGFHGDTAATFAVGSISDEAKHLIETTRRSFFEAVKMARADNRLNDVSKTVESVATSEGYSVVTEFIGHGVGHNLHENPDVPNYDMGRRGIKLIPGMTFAIEPMVNTGTMDIRCLDNKWTIITLDGKLSAHYEHTIAITEGEPIILTEPDEGCL
ncbi:MAG: type I methionyl aminopeptidase [Clostridiales bacterium GWF2_38_85]|nr:MAG: type I methionyl aminopeptidase [Clostridiales bacterium GWF2_38_85]HBL84925.1 type I methionyl aminopeptidase [Clostridiales bacterium]